MLRHKKTVVAANLEAYTNGTKAYGNLDVPATSELTGGQVISVIDPKLTPMAGEAKDLNYIRPWMGASNKVQAWKSVELSFKTPLVGLNNKTMPAWNELIKMCGFSSTSVKNKTNLIVNSNAASGQAVIVLKSIDKRTKVGDTVTGAGIAALSTIFSINLNAKSITLNNNLTAKINKDAQITVTFNNITKATTATAAIGATTLTFANVADLFIGQQAVHAGIPADTFISDINANAITLSAVTTSAITSGASVTFPLYSGVDYETIDNQFYYGTILTYMDKIAHKMIGVRGNLKLSLVVGEIPTMEFIFKGLFVQPTDPAALSDMSYLRWIDPLAVNQKNTVVKINDNILNASKFELDIGNNVEYRNLTNSENVLIVDRNTTGTISWECDEATAIEWFDFVANGETGVLTVTHGALDNLVTISANNISLSALNYEEKSGIYFFSANITVIQVSDTDIFSIRAS